MTLYFRLINLLIRLRFIKKKSPLDVSVMKSRVWPTDLDFQMHMTNARYLSLMDLGRTHLLGQSGLIKLVLDHKLLPVVNSVAMTYIRSLEPFQKFELLTKVIYWDDRYFYMEQRFMHKDKLYAVGLVRGVFLDGKAVCSTDALLRKLGLDVDLPDMPEAVKSWQSFLAEKKSHTASSV